MPTSVMAHSATLASLFTLTMCAALVACGGSGSSPAPAPTPAPAPAPTATPTSFKSASTDAQKKIMSEMPHLTNASIVTGLNDAPMFRWRGLFAEAVAADFGLSGIWDPESGAAPHGSDFAVSNLYIGGGFTCSSPDVNTCTKDGVTVAGLESLKNYIGQALDPNFLNSNGASITVFGRLQSALMVPCALGQLTTTLDTDGLPPAGALTLSFPSDTTNAVYQTASLGGCGLPSELAGMSISGTVTTVSGGAYAKKIVMATPGGTSSTVWVKLDTTAGTMDLMTLEDQRPQRYAADRAIVHMSNLGTAGAAKIAFEYVSMGSADGSNSDSCFSTSNGWSCDFDLHRGYIDEAADVAVLVSTMGSPSTSTDATGVAAPTSYIRYTAAAKPSALAACTAGTSCTGTLALSVTADGQQMPTTAGAYPSAGNAYAACVDLASRSIANDDTLACDVTGSSVLAPGGASTMIEATREIYAGDVMATLLAGTTDSTTLAFTGSADIFTAPDTH